MRTGLLTASVLLFSSALPAQSPAECCDSLYRLGFSRQFIRSTVPGEGILDASDTCAASGAVVKEHKRFSLLVNTISNALKADEAIQGLTLSVEVDGGIAISDAQLVGYADFFGTGGGGSAQFARIDLADPAKNGGRRGLVAAVIFPEGPVGNLRVGPPHKSTESLVEMQVDRLDPSDTNATGRIFFADGLRGAGQPTSNFLTVQGATSSACNAPGAEVRISFNDKAPFRRGDPNEDARIDISDAVFIFNYLFLGTQGPGCMKSADANGDGRLDISDPSFILNFLFYGSSAPPDPGPPPQACSEGPAEETLGCGDYGGCGG